MANEITGALAQLPGFEKTPETPETTKNSEGLTTNVSGVSIPGYGKISGSVQTKIGPEVLQNMQRLIDQKYGGVNSFLNPLVGGLKDAASILNGTMNQRDAEKRAEEQQLLQMQNFMSAFKGQQAAGKDWQQSVGYGAQPQQAQAGDGAQPQQAQAGAGPAIFEQQILSLPKEMRPIALDYLKNGQQNEYNSLITSYALKLPDKMKILSAANELSDTDPKKRLMLQAAVPEAAAPQSYIDPKTGKTQPYSLPQFMPPGVGGAQPQPGAGGANIPDAEAWAKSQGITISPRGGNRDFNAQVDQFVQNPTLAAAPGTSPHEQKRALDIPAQFRNDPAVKGKLEAAGFRATNPNEPWHYELPKTTAAAETPSTADVDTSKEGVALRYGNIEKANTAFVENTYKPLAAKAMAAQDDVMYADRVLGAIKDEKFGPASSIELGVIKAKMMAGLPVKPEEEAKYLKGLTIENAKQQGVAMGAKAAMGAQYTGKESENFAKTLAGINDPNEYIKTIYQIRKAKSLVDQAHTRFLEQHPEDMLTAEKNWNNRGVKEQIFRDTVDEFAKLKPANTPSAAKDNFAAQAKQKFGAYEPDKWNYGKDDKGFYREPK
jgi:hypothetical protein